MDNQVRELDSYNIVAGDNDRQHFDHQGLVDLAESISTDGLAQPIVVRPVLSCAACYTLRSNTLERCPKCQSLHFAHRYQIVAGERRFRAMSTILMRETIPAIVRNDLTDEKASAIMLVENSMRADLNPIEEAHAYQKRMTQFDWTMAEVARRAHVSGTKVASRLRLLDLVPEIQHLVAVGRFPIKFGELMADLDSNRQRIAVQWLMKQPTNPTTAAFSKIVSELLGKQAQDDMFKDMVFFDPNVEQSITDSETGKLQDILPRLPGLPCLPTKKGSIAKVIDSYVAELIRQGQTRAANVLLDFWSKAMDANYAKMSPYESQTLKALKSNPPAEQVGQVTFRIVAETRSSLIEF